MTTGGHGYSSDEYTMMYRGQEIGEVYKNGELVWKDMMTYDPAAEFLIAVKVSKDYPRSVVEASIGDIASYYRKIGYYHGYSNVYVVRPKIRNSWVYDYLYPYYDGRYTPDIPYFTMSLVPSLMAILTPLPPSLNTSIVFPAFCKNCSLLEYLPDNLFRNITKYRSASAQLKEFCYGCSSLPEIPKDLFDYFPTTIYSLKSTFENCSSLREIPDRLFHRFNGTTNFINAFKGCTSITRAPSMVFPENTTLSIKGAFMDCTSLAIIPDDFFSNQHMIMTVTGIVGYSEMENLFRNCVSLKRIPDGFFKRTLIRKTGPHSVHGMFAGCSSLTYIPEQLFIDTYNPDGPNLDYWILDYSSCFKDCISLEYFPENLLRNSECNSGHFDYMFAGCTNLKRLPAGDPSYPVHQWLNPDGSTVHSWVENMSAQYMFDGCIGLTGIIPDDAWRHFRFRTGMFRGCVNAANYDSLPDNLKQ